MDIYPLYKPLRNFLRQCPLLESLAVVRAYIQHIQFDQALPQDIEIPTLQAKTHWTQKKFYAWKLELLAKELILHGTRRGIHDLRKWHDFANAIRHVRYLEEEIAEKSIHERNVMLEVSRIAHRQFPWQQRPNGGTVSRYFRIFSHEGLSKLLERKLNLTITELYTTGHLICGGFLRTTYLHLDTSPIPNLSTEALNRFVTAFSISLKDIKEEIRQTQSYNESFAYAFNPLRASPLIQTEWECRPALICPAPTLLFNRFTSGVYYELADLKGFSVAFGNAFQAYVGDMATRVNELLGDLFEIREERTYNKGQNRTIDWILSDKTAHIFIECKTKRMRLGSKQALEMNGALETDLAKMAEFVVQAYKALDDALDDQYPHWSPDNRPVYPVVVTLENWYLFDIQARPYLDNLVRIALNRFGLDPDIIERYPYYISSVEELEITLQVMARVGIQTVMNKKHSEERERWKIMPVLQHEFADEYNKSTLNLFPEDKTRIINIHPTNKS